MAKKYALLIGNNEYVDQRLPMLNASIRDIEALEQVLLNKEICGFDEVKLLPNPSFKESMRELSLLFTDKTKDDLLLFYFSGHGVKDHAGDLFFAIKESEWDLCDGTAIAATQLKNIVNKSGSHRQVLILDCCHSGAIAKGFKGSNQLLAEDTFDIKGYGREIMTATDSLQLAKDGDLSSVGEQQSLFTRYLVEGLETGDAAAPDSETVTVEQLYQYVHGRVKAVNPEMTPHYWCDRADGRINLAKNPRPVFMLPEDLLNDLQDPKVRLRLGALHEIKSLLEQSDIAKHRAVMTALGQCKDVERDRFVYQEIESLLNKYTSNSSGNNDKPIEISGKPDKKLLLEPGGIFRDTLKDGSEGLEMVVIPKGQFRMGDIQNTGDGDEKPVHNITIAKPFALGKYPVTFAEYDYFCEKNGDKKPDDKKWRRDKRPVINVSWQEAITYAKWLSAETGKSYRLTSEAEWEYAARAGTETDYWWGNELSQEYANYGGEKTSPVDKFKPNAFGLHDMSGNVWEWVEDCYHESYKDKAMKDGSAWVSGSCEFRVLRGGSWNDNPWYLRSATRFRSLPQDRYFSVGFRLVQDL